MPQSLYLLLVYVAFSTKNREPFFAAPDVLYCGHGQRGQAGGAHVVGSGWLGTGRAGFCPWLTPDAG